LTDDSVLIVGTLDEVGTCMSCPFEWVLVRLTADMPVVPTEIQLARGALEGEEVFPLADRTVMAYRGIVHFE
jgi:hypothetical protein